MPAKKKLDADYVKYMLNNSHESTWSKFVGRCVLVGVSENIDFIDTFNYACKVFRNTKVKDIDEDIDVIRTKLRKHLKNQRNKMEADGSTKGLLPEC